MKDFNWDNYPKRVLNEQDPWLPFPGIYPTRWAIKLQWGTHPKTKKFAHTWRYLGKPSQQVAVFVRQALQTKSYLYLEATEFIRNGAIASGRAYGPRTSLPVNGWCRSKCYLVDPWAGYPHERMITTWADYQIYPLPLVYKGHKFVIYATAAAPTTSRLEVYKQWLDRSNIKFSRQ